MSILEYWDKCATLWINSFHSQVSDRIWLLFSDKEVWIPLYVLIAVLLFVKLGWKKAIVAILCIALTVAACDQFANLVKDAAARLRPNKDQWMIERGLHILEKGGKYGFFSAHAANSFGLAMVTSRLLRAHSRNRDMLRLYNPVIFSWAVLVSLSRIFVAKHFLGDVFVGMLVGLLFGWAMSVTGNYLCRIRALAAESGRQGQR